MVRYTGSEKNIYIVTGDMAQRLRALADTEEGVRQFLAPKWRLTPVTAVPGVQCPLLALQAQGVNTVHIHTCKQSIHAPFILHSYT